MVFNGMVTLEGFYLDASSILKCELDNGDHAFQMSIYVSMV